MAGNPYPLLLGALALLGPAVAQAQALNPAGDDPCCSHRGPFVRAEAGEAARFFFASGNQTSLGGSQTLVGAETQGGLLLGWTVYPPQNMIVHAQVLGGISAALRGIDGTLGASDVASEFVSAGLGLTGYGPTDVSLTPMVGYIHRWWSAGSARPLPAQMDGVMAGLQAGKEWWLNKVLLIGAIGQLDYEYVLGGGQGWHSFGAGAHFSLTYN